MYQTLHPSKATRQRNRRWGVAAAAAVVVGAAIIAPALFLANDEDAPGTAPAVTGQSPGSSRLESPTPSMTPDGQTPGTYDLLEGVTAGAPPRVAYLDGDRLVRPDGTTLELPRVYDQFAEVGERVYGAFDNSGTRIIHLVDRTGNQIGEAGLEGSFVVSAAGDIVAWATPGGEVETMWEADYLSFGNQGGPVSVAAVTGRGSCLVDDGGCWVYVNNQGDQPPAAVHSDGSVAEVAPGAIKVNDVHPSGLRAVQLSYSDTGSCSGVYDADQRRFLWKTCDNSLFRFSPDGAYLLASDPYLDGIGLGSISVLDVRTGEPVAEFRIRGGFIDQQMWEDDTHALVVVSGPDGWEMLRLGLDGTRERVAGPVAPKPDPTLSLLTLPGSV